MGEAKSARLREKRASCICGSGRAAGICCFVGKRWFRQPADVRLSDFTGVDVAGCYLAGRQSCSGSLSREHLISNAALRVLDDRQLEISGVPWLAVGETKTLPLDAFVGKCLCEKHNSALSPLDAEGGRLMAAIRSIFIDAHQLPRRELFSGHDIERWALKSFLAMAYSGNLGADGVVLEPRFFGRILPAAQMLENCLAWPPGTGLYVDGFVGAQLEMKAQIEFAPLLTDETDELIGAAFRLGGLRFALFFAQAPPLPPKKMSGYRLEAIKLAGGPRPSSLELSWLDRTHPYHRL